MIPDPIAIGENNTKFLYYHFEIIKNEKLEQSILIISKSSSPDLFDYRVSKCRKMSFMKK